MPRGWKRWLAIAAGVALALRAALPWVIEWAAERRGIKALGVPLRVGDVDLHLYRGGLALEDLRVGNRAQPADTAEIDPATTLLSVERAWVRIAWLDLLRGRIRLRELELDAPRVRVEREADGRVVPLPERAGAPPEPTGDEAETTAVPPLAIDRFALRGAHLGLTPAGDPGRELLGFGLEELTLADFTFDEDGIAFGAIGIRRPSLRVRRELALGEDVPAAPPAAEPPPVGAAPAAGEATPRPPLRARRIEIERAAFTLQMPDSDLDVVMHLEADGVTAVRGETFPAQISLELAQGKLQAEGTVGIDPPLFDGALHWQGIAVRPLLEPLPGDRIKALDSATANGDLKVALALVPADGSAPELRVSGALGLADVKGRVPGQDLALAWKSLDIEIDELRVPLQAEGSPAPGAPRVALRRVRLVEPAARVAIAAAPADGAAPESAEPPPVDSGPAPLPPRISLGQLELVRGRVEFVDRSISPEYHAQLRSLNVSARDLRWPEGSVRDLRAGFTGPDEAVLDLRGGLKDRAGELNLTLHQLALAGFNPYAKSLAGIELERGTFALTTSARAGSAGWDLNNDVLLHDLSLASGESANVPSVGLPISAVLALLRDPQGDIRLGVPVQVDGEGARAGVGSIIRSALRQALVGVVSSPLKVLGFGKPGEDAQPASLGCAPGAAELDAREAERLGAIAALLAERPALGLVLRGRAGGADSASVAEQVLREALVAGRAPELPDSGFLQRRRLRNALEARARGETDELDDEDRAALERWIAATPVPPQRLQTLAALRGELLLETLATLHGVPRARLSLADPLEGEPAVALEIGAAAAP